MKEKSAAEQLVSNLISGRYDIAGDVLRRMQGESQDSLADIADRHSVSKTTVARLDKHLKSCTHE